MNEKDPLAPNFSLAQTPQQMALSGVNGTPTNQPITAEAMRPQQAIQPVTVPQQQIPQGTTDILQSQLDAINAQYAPTAQDQEIGAERTKVQDLIGQLYGSNGETSTRARLDTDPALMAKRQQVQDLTAQANALIAESRAIPLQLEQEAIGKGITSRVLSAQQQGALRQNAIRSLTVSSLLSAAQGDLTLALDQVDRAINAEFAPKRAELDARKQNLEMLMNDPSLTKEEAKRAAITQARLQDQERELEKEESNKKAAGDARVALIKNNPQISGEAITALQRAQTPEDIAIIASAFGLSNLNQQQQFDQRMQEQKFLQDQKQFGMEYALQQKKFDEDKRQFDEIYIQNQQKIDQVAQTTQTDPRQITAYADQYASTGSLTGIPKELVGVVTEAAKEAPKSPGTLISKVTGVVDAKIPATEQQDFTRLAAILKNVERLEQINKGRIGGVVAGSLGALTGSQTQAQYIATRKAIVDDISRMQSGAALTQDEVAFYEDYLPGRFSDTYVGPIKIGQDSQKKIENFKRIMENRLRDRLDTNNLAIVGFSKVKLDDGNEYTVGDIITNDQGQRGRINADGSITLVQ